MEGESGGETVRLALRMWRYEWVTAWAVARERGEIQGESGMGVKYLLRV